MVGVGKWNLCYGLSCFHYFSSDLYVWLPYFTYPYLSFDRFIKPMGWKLPQKGFGSQRLPYGNNKTRAFPKFVVNLLHVDPSY